MSSTKRLSVLFRLSVLIGSTLIALIPVLTLANVPRSDPPPSQEAPGDAWLTHSVVSVLEENPEEAALRVDLEAFEAARSQGPEAVVALGESLRGRARDLVMNEIVAAQMQLAREAHAPGGAIAVDPADEEAAVQAQAALDAASRAQALAYADDPREGTQSDGDISQAQITPPAQPAADRTVGNGCTYATIGTAIAAANPDDRLLIEGGVTFIENVVVNKNLILQGGYAGCASGSSDRTIVRGTASGPVVIVNAGLTATLENLEITNGVTGFEGGGIRFAYGSGTGTLNLSNVRIYGNTAAWGGGLWVGQSAQVSGANVGIYSNTASSFGGGLRLFGASGVFSDTNIYANTAPLGAGVYGTLQTSAPSLELRSYADIHDNLALTGSGLGGGVYMRQGAILLTDCSDIYSNDAMNGGGAYLITSTLTVRGDCSEIESNLATGFGGGIYAQGSTINIQQDAELYNNEAGTSGTGSGGAAYLDNSDLWGDKALIYYNTTDDFGGGVYATNGSLLDMDLGTYDCTGPRCSQLSYNIAANSYGGGVYATGGSEVDLRQVFVENNTATLGGGIYANQSPVFLYNTLVARNNATVSASDGVRLFNGSSLAGSNNTFAHNDAGGATTGTAINMSGSSLSLSNTIVWGHTTSINDLAQTITCSDIQGGYAGADNMDIAPQFIDPAIANFHLQSLSPVIDRCASGQSRDFDNEIRPVTYIRPATPYDMGADEASARVGINGAACAYGRIQDAVDSAAPGAVIQAASEVFYETVDIMGRNLTIAGGFNANCTTDIAGVTIINGAGAGSVFEIDESLVTLRALDITGGNSGAGGGISVLPGASRVTLDSADVFNNQASFGGGVYVDVGNVLTITNDSDIHHNTATALGGGVRLWGKIVADDWNSSITNNTAPDGGGVSVPGGVLELRSSHVTNNQATAVTGRGGGIHVYGSGIITATNSSNIANNSAYNGAGIYADDARVYLTAVVHSNGAANNGGGVYLTNGSALSASSTYIGYPASGWGGNQAVNGAGIYVDASTLNFNGYIVNNTASSNGGGMYAQASSVQLTGATVGGAGANRPNRIGATGLNGGGLYLTQGTHATLQNTVVSSNTLTNLLTGYGGGLYVRDSSVVTITNSRIERHFLPSSTDGRGGGIYLYGSTVTLDNSDVLSNTVNNLGGGIRVFDSGTLNVIHGSELRNNHALNGEGGAIAAATGSPSISLSEATLIRNSASTDGGAIYQNAGTLDFTGGWTLRSNEAGGNGGALAVAGTADADFVAESYSLIYANKAQGGNGGALYLANSDTAQLRATSGAQLYIYANTAQTNGGALYADNGGTFDIYGQVDFDRNWALTGHGGAIYLSNGSSIWLDDYVDIGPALWENRSASGNGGAIYAVNSPRVELDGAILGRAGEGNLAMAGSGGALYLSGSTFHAENCTFQDNRAAMDGGAIAAETSSLTLVARFVSVLSYQTPEDVHAPAAPQATACDPATRQCSALLGNAADSDTNSSGDGGAIYANDSTLSINHTYLIHNTSYRGGAIYQTGVGAVAEVSNSLIHSNAVAIALGAGIRSSGGAFTLQHVTLADNLGGAAYSQASTSSAIHNSIAWGNDDGFQGTFTASSCNIDQEGNAGFNVDPEFVNPGAGEDYHLKGSSPAIDACPTGLTPDLDNVTRPQGDGYDMGAYEGKAGTLVYLPLVAKQNE